RAGDSGGENFIELRERVLRAINLRVYLIDASVQDVVSEPKLAEFCPAVNVGDVVFSLPPARPPPGAVFDIVDLAIEFVELALISLQEFLQSPQRSHAADSDSHGRREHDVALGNFGDGVEA